MFEAVILISQVLMTSISNIYILNEHIYSN